MKLVIYRNKQTNKIVMYHEVRPSCTEEALHTFNNDESQKNKAEIVELDDIAEYFYTLKTCAIEEEAENLRDLMNELESIANRIDDRLYDFDMWFKEERGDK